MSKEKPEVLGSIPSDIHILPWHFFRPFKWETFTLIIIVVVIITIIIIIIVIIIIIIIIVVIIIIIISHWNLPSWLLWVSGGWFLVQDSVHCTTE